MTIATRKLSSLHADERGAMMLMSVFMALIAVAMLYYVAAVGESVAFRERVQDGADSTAYVGAVVMARSMNIVVIMNLAIASIFASAVITQTVYWTFVAAQAAASAACAAWCVSCCAAAFCLIFDEFEACSDNNRVEREVRRAAQAADRVQDRLQSYSNEIALAASVEVATFFGDPVVTGLSYGRGLPIRDDTRESIMCDKTLGGFTQMAVIAALAQIQAQSISCSAGGARGFVAAAAIGSLLLPFYCSISHGNVRPRAARLNGGVNQGDNNFQFYGGVFGDDPPITENDARVGVARWSTSGSSAVDSLGLRNIAHVGIAQSEYYHGSNDSNNDIMWSVQWRARLRRFNAAGAAGSVCSGGLSQICGALSAVVVH